MSGDVVDAVKAFQQHTEGQIEEQQELPTVRQFAQTPESNTFPLHCLHGINLKPHCHDCNLFAIRFPASHSNPPFKAVAHHYCVAGVTVAARTRWALLSLMLSPDLPVPCYGIEPEWTGTDVFVTAAAKDSAFVHNPFTKFQTIACTPGWPTDRTLLMYKREHLTLREDGRLDHTGNQKCE